MLFFLFTAKENQSPLKSVDGDFYFRVFFDGFPSFGHGSGPMDVVENPNRFVSDGW
jgi:hypothetical protein